MGFHPDRPDDDNCSYPSTVSVPVAAGDLHKHYTAAQLELGLLRSKSAKIDKQINELKELAEKLKADIAVKEKT